jgi:fructose-1-phosphate kinase PfkB-like protein
MIGLCGSLPRGVPDDYYGTLIDIAAAHHIPVILDTSGVPLAEGVKHRPYMIKPNREEAIELTGGSTMEEVTSRVKSMTVLVPAISLTLGGEGALLFRHDRTMRGRSTMGAAVNPVGAGDSFVGGYMAAFSRFGDDPVSSFRWALAAAACTARATGITWPPGEFENALRTIELEEVP